MAAAKGQPTGQPKPALAKTTARQAANTSKRRRVARAPEPAGRADPTTDPAGYEVDFYLWAYSQADLLRSGRYAQLDLPNLIEELETLGRSDRRKLFSAYSLLLHHLLKWQFQPRRRSRSWRVTIRNARDTIEMIERESTSLKQDAEQDLQDIYWKARALAADETGLPLATFPAECPYTIAFLRRDGALPDDSPEGMTTP